MNRLGVSTFRSAVLAATLTFFGSSITLAGDLKGVVSFDGKRPVPKNIVKRFQADAVCLQMHWDPKSGRATQVRNEDVIVSKDLKVRNAFVYIKGGLDDTEYPAPAEPAKLNQKGCLYAPHVQGMMAGQWLWITNSDKTMHNVHSLPKRNKPINQGQAVPGTLKVDVMKRAEVVKFKCDIHPWMAAYIHVMDHPFFAVTNSKGEFTIPDVPPGTYEVAAWHEVFGEVTASVTVGADGAMQEFTLKAKGDEE